MSKPLTPIQWLICATAAIGFAFDIYALLVAPLIMQPALLEISGYKPGTPQFNDWVGYLFYIPAMAGGLFGMIGGYMTDLWGRRRVLVLSILIYSFSALASGFSTSLEMLLFLRCTTFIGVCVEFVAAVAWLAELFDDKEQREKVLGYTQAFSSIGGFLVAFTYRLCVQYASVLPEINGGHSAWRYTLISGVIPAIPLIIIRPFLPESPKWAQQKAAGTLRRPSFAELFAPQYAKATWITMIMYGMSYGAAFGAILHLPRIVPGMPEVAGLAKNLQQITVTDVQFFQEAGGLIGRIVLAILAVRIVSRRLLLRIFQIPGLIIIPLVFFYPATNNLELLKWGVALAGFFTVAQFSFWGNYLPGIYPTHLRGTGESFAANIGGRVLGTSAALVTTKLATSMTGTSASMKLAYAAGTVALAVYVIGFLCSFALPEPPEKLPE